MSRPYRKGLEGHWLEVARAVVNGAGTHREIAEAIRKPTEGVNRIQRGVAYSVPEMQKCGLIGRDDVGRFCLTIKGWDQLGQADA